MPHSIRDFDTTRKNKLTTTHKNHHDADERRPWNRDRYHDPNVGDEVEEQVPGARIINSLNPSRSRKDPKSCTATDDLITCQQSSHYGDYAGDISNDNYGNNGINDTSDCPSWLMRHLKGQRIRQSAQAHGCSDDADRDSFLASDSGRGWDSRLEQPGTDSIMIGDRSYNNGYGDHPKPYPTQRRSRHKILLSPPVESPPLSTRYDTVGRSTRPCTDPTNKDGSNKNPATFKKCMGPTNHGSPSQGQPKPDNHTLESFRLGCDLPGASPLQTSSLLEEGRSTEEESYNVAPDKFDTDSMTSSTATKVVAVNGFDCDIAHLDIDNFTPDQIQELYSQSQSSRWSDSYTISPTPPRRGAVKPSYRGCGNGQEKDGGGAKKCRLNNSVDPYIRRSNHGNDPNARSLSSHDGPSQNTRAKYTHTTNATPLNCRRRRRVSGDIKSLNDSADGLCRSRSRADDSMMGSSSINSCDVEEDITSDTVNKSGHGSSATLVKDRAYCGYYTATTKSRSRSSRCRCGIRSVMNYPGSVVEPSYDIRDSCDGPQRSPGLRDGSRPGRRRRPLSQQQALPHSYEGCQALRKRHSNNLEWKGVDYIPTAGELDMDGIIDEHFKFTEHSLYSTDCQVPHKSSGTSRSIIGGGQAIESSRRRTNDPGGRPSIGSKKDGYRCSDNNVEIFSCHRDLRKGCRHRNGLTTHMDQIGTRPIDDTLTPTLRSGSISPAIASEFYNADNVAASTTTSTATSLGDDSETSDERDSCFVEASSSTQPSCCNTTEDDEETVHDHQNCRDNYPRPNIPSYHGSRDATISDDRFGDRDAIFSSSEGILAGNGTITVGTEGSSNDSLPDTKISSHCLVTAENRANIMNNYTLAFDNGHISSSSTLSSLTQSHQKSAAGLRALEASGPVKLVETSIDRKMSKHQRGSRYQRSSLVRDETFLINRPPDGNHVDHVSADSRTETTTWKEVVSLDRGRSLFQGVRRGRPTDLSIIPVNHNTDRRGVISDPGSYCRNGSVARSGGTEEGYERPTNLILSPDNFISRTTFSANASYQGDDQNYRNASLLPSSTGRDGCLPASASRDPPSPGSAGTSGYRSSGSGSGALQSLVTLFRQKKAAAAQASSTCHDRDTNDFGDRVDEGSDNSPGVQFPNVGEDSIFSPAQETEIIFSHISSGSRTRRHTPNQDGGRGNDSSGSSDGWDDGEEPYRATVPRLGHYNDTLGVDSGDELTSPEAGSGGGGPSYDKLEGGDRPTASPDSGDLVDHVDNGNFGAVMSLLQKLILQIISLLCFKPAPPGLAGLGQLRDQVCQGLNPDQSSDNSNIPMALAQQIIQTVNRSSANTSLGDRSWDSDQGRSREDKRNKGQGPKRENTMGHKDNSEPDNNKGGVDKDDNSSTLLLTILASLSLTLLLFEKPKTSSSRLNNESEVNVSKNASCKRTKKRIIPEIKRNKETDNRCRSKSSTPIKGFGQSVTCEFLSTSPILSLMEESIRLRGTQLTNSISMTSSQQHLRNDDKGIKGDVSLRSDRPPSITFASPTNLINYNNNNNDDNNITVPNQQRPYYTLTPRDEIILNQGVFHPRIQEHVGDGTMCYEELACLGSDEPTGSSLKPNAVTVPGEIELGSFYSSGTNNATFVLGTTPTVSSPDLPDLAFLRQKWLRMKRAEESCYDRIRGLNEVITPNPDLLRVSGVIMDSGGSESGPCQRTTIDTTEQSSGCVKELSRRRSSPIVEENEEEEEETDVEGEGAEEGRERKEEPSRCLRAQSTVEVGAPRFSEEAKLTSPNSNPNPTAGKNFGGYNTGMSSTRNITADTSCGPFGRNVKSSISCPGELNKMKKTVSFSEEIFLHEISDRCSLSSSPDREILNRTLDHTPMDNARDPRLQSRDSSDDDVTMTSSNHTNQGHPNVAKPPKRRYRCDGRRRNFSQTEIDEAVKIHAIQRTRIHSIPTEDENPPTQFVSGLMDVIDSWNQGDHNPVGDLMDVIESPFVEGTIQAISQIYKYFGLQGLFQPSFDPRRFQSGIDPQLMDSIKNEIAANQDTVILLGDSRKSPEVCHTIQTIFCPTIIRLILNMNNESANLSELSPKTNAAVLDKLWDQIIDLNLLVKLVNPIYMDLVEAIERNNPQHDNSDSISSIQTPNKADDTYKSACGNENRHTKIDAFICGLLNLKSLGLWLKIYFSKLTIRENISSEGVTHTLSPLYVDIICHLLDLLKPLPFRIFLPTILNRLKQDNLVRGEDPKKLPPLKADDSENINKFGVSDNGSLRQHLESKRSRIPILVKTYPPPTLVSPVMSKIHSFKSHSPVDRYSPLGTYINTGGDHILKSPNPIVPIFEDNQNHDKPPTSFVGKFFPKFSTNHNRSCTNGEGSNILSRLTPRLSRKNKENSNMDALLSPLSSPFSTGTVNLFRKRSFTISRIDNINGCVGEKADFSLDNNGTKKDAPLSCAIKKNRFSFRKEIVSYPPKKNVSNSSNQHNESFPTKAIKQEKAMNEIIENITFKNARISKDQSRSNRKIISPNNNGNGKLLSKDISTKSHSNRSLTPSKLILPKLKSIPKIPDSTPVTKFTKMKNEITKRFLKAALNSTNVKRLHDSQIKIKDCAKPSSTRNLNNDNGKNKNAVQLNHLQLNGLLNNTSINNSVISQNNADISSHSMDSQGSILFSSSNQTRNCSKMDSNNYQSIEKTSSSESGIGSSGDTTIPMESKITIAYTACQ